MNDTPQNKCTGERPLWRTHDLDLALPHPFHNNTYFIVLISNRQIENTKTKLIIFLRCRLLISTTVEKSNSHQDPSYF